MEKERFWAGFVGVVGGGGEDRCAVLFILSRYRGLDWSLESSGGWRNLGSL